MKSGNLVIAGALALGFAVMAARIQPGALPPGAGIPLTRRFEGVRARKAVAAGSRW